jgi:integrase
MPQQSLDPFKRHPTRHRGISYRLRADGSRRLRGQLGGPLYPGRDRREAGARQAGRLAASEGRGEKPVLPSKTTFGELAEKWLASKHRLRETTLKDYRRHLDQELLPRFRTHQLAALDVDVIAAFIRALEQRGLQPATIKNICKPLHGILREARRRRKIDSDPFELLTRDERVQASRRRVYEWGDEELERLHACAAALDARPTAQQAYAPILFLAARTGLRLGELLGLLWQDFDKDDASLRVERQWTRLGAYGPPKTESARRRIPLGPELRDYLIQLRLRSKHSQDEQPIFASRNGKPLGHRNVTRRGFEAAAEKAEIEGVTFHELRHAAASRLIAKSLPVTMVADVLGHASPAITLEVYAQLFNRLASDERVRAVL